MVLTHRAGIPGFEPPLPFEDHHDWDLVIGSIEAMEPWTDPGTVACYHPITFGFVLGELCRRLTGSVASEFYADEVGSRAGVDFRFGITDRADLDRLAEISWPVKPPELEPGSMIDRVFQSLGPGDPTTWVHRSAEVPSSVAFSNARALAELGSIFALDGTWNGVRYLAPELVREASTEQCYVEDQACGWISYGLTFGLHSDAYPAPTPTSFHWGGFGGSWWLMDRPSRVSVAYVMNDFHGQRTSARPGSGRPWVRSFRPWPTEPRPARN